MQQPSIKVLAERVLARNRQRNSAATNVLPRRVRNDPPLPHAKPAFQVFEYRLEGSGPWLSLFSIRRGDTMAKVKKDLEARFGCGVAVRSRDGS